MTEFGILINTISRMKILLFSYSFIISKKEKQNEIEKSLPTLMEGDGHVLNT